MTALLLALAAPLRAAGGVPPELRGVGVAEHLGRPVDLDLRFTDWEGREVRLRDYVRGDVPVVLTLNWYGCTNLCGVQLEALVAGIRELGWLPGDRYRVVTVSIDPREGPELAAGKRESVLSALGGGDWAFLVGEEPEIRALADAIGYAYRYDERTDQYAHPAVIAVLSPEGVVARYLYGIDYPARDLRFALMEAAAGRLGSPADKLLLSCFHFDTTTGRYTPQALGIMRLGGVLTLVGLGALGAVMWRRERERGDA